ncbi:hypothetical protein C8A00DRAFT_11016 [Chaetomidium leptoderma]|uniref:Protein phosphatase n=1 Tax=Chaetomidium leptoderma TaxID=669021 RepID=A0AAN6VUZ2_9PEZI|nr:hypothetical protein C8A00DRAFT_11016 [Chaetomidium leptoderma]
MRRLVAARLLAPASHARLRLRGAAATTAAAPVSHSGIATHVLPPSARSTATWRCRPRPSQDHLPAQKRQIHLTTPLSQDHPPSSSPSPSPPSTTTTTGSAPPPPPPLLDEDGKLDSAAGVFSNLPFRFDTGIALFAKRTPRPFPPPYLSPPSGSFSDPLSTHDRSRDRRRRRAYVGGHLIQGLTNGDDAVFASDCFVCANDGVGAWSTRPRGHAGLWARLILHFWATALFEDAAREGASYRPDPVACLQRAYEQTIEATGPPNDWQGTTTAAGAQLHYRRRRRNPDHTDDNDKGTTTATTTTTTQKPLEGQTSDGNAAAEGEGDDVEPLLYVTNLGDSQVMVVRPSTREVVYKSTEQWHWFDCPRQLGTNSPDTPRNCAVVDEVPIREGDVVLAMSDGVIDNLWAHEIADKVSESVESWRRRRQRVLAAVAEGDHDDDDDDRDGIQFVAEELMEAAKTIALDPFAESPFMEHAIEEGLASVGGKLDDISVVAAICRRNDR